MPCNLEVNLITRLGDIAKQELPLAAIFVGGMGRNEESL
jgi:hypothetical protein